MIQVYWQKVAKRLLKLLKHVLLNHEPKKTWTLFMILVLIIYNPYSIDVKSQVETQNHEADTEHNLWKHKHCYLWFIMASLQLFKPVFSRITSNASSGASRALCGLEIGIGMTGRTGPANVVYWPSLVIFYSCKYSLGYLHVLGRNFVL